MVTVQDNESNKYKLLKFLPIDGEEENKYVSYLSSDKVNHKFTGTSYHYELDGNLTLVQGYKGGKVVSERGGTLEKGYSRGSSLRAPSDEPCHSCGKEGIWMQVVTEHYNDWYQNFGSGWVQVGSDYLGSTTEWVYVPNQDYTNNPQPEHLHRPQRTDKVPHRPTKPPHITEVIIDPRIRNTVLECIFNKLRATNTLSKYIARFDGDFSVAHLRFNTTTKLLSSEREPRLIPLLEGRLHQIML